MNCMIHLLAWGEDLPSAGMIDGTSLCAGCATAVGERVDWIRLDMNTRFHLLATIAHLKRDPWSHAQATRHVRDPQKDLNERSATS